MYIDFHSHILPNMDDGSKSVEMSLEMLSIAYRNNAETVLLTPHINASSDIEAFLDLRKQRFNELTLAINQASMSSPKLLLGAEVLLDSALSEHENIAPLCIEGTKLILLEFPYTPWNSWYNHEIYNLMSKHNVTPVVAHIERYIKSPKDMAKLDALVSYGVKFQINASSFLSFTGRHIIRELAANGLISAIGSDAHNLSYRSPDISKPLKAFGKKFGPGFIEYIYNKTYNLLNDFKIGYNAKERIDF